MKRNLLMGIGLIFLGIGTIGIFLPVLPTVPFYIVAAFCFSRSSPRLHEWILARPVYGQHVRNWENHGMIPRKAKWFASLSLTPLLIYACLLNDHIVSHHWLVRAGILIVYSSVTAFIWSRPEK